MEVNQRAISDRGWGPLHRKLLEHPHLVSDKGFEKNSSQSSNVLLGLNISNAEGVAGSVLDRIVRERVKNEAAKQAAERRLADGKNIQKNIKDAKRLSAGMLAKNGVFALDNADFIAGVKARQDREKAVKFEKARRKKNIIRTNAKKVKAAREKNGHESIHYFKKFSMDECGAYLQYKRVTKDPAMPKNISERRKRCLDVMHRGSPFVSPQTSDDKDGVDERGEAERGCQSIDGDGTRGGKQQLFD